MTRWKKAAALSCLICLVTTTTASGANLQDKLEQYQQQKSELDSQLKDQKKQTDAVNSQITALNQSIKALNDSIKNSKIEISKQQAQLNDLQSKQQNLTQEKTDHVNSLNSFIRANYEDGGASYLNVILGSASWSDFLDRVYQIQCIMQKYNQLIADINKLTKEISDQQTQINQKTASLQAALKEKENSQNYSQQVLAKQQSLYAQLSTQQKATAVAAANAQNNIDIVQEQIRQEEEDAALAKQKPISGGGSGISGPVKLDGGAGPIANYAVQFVGVPYVWGGTSSSGWDCSGFVQYVFRHFGVSLYRVSQDQFTEGTPVAKDDLRPGDVVFFSTYAPGASHVGIYIGGGQMVNAASTKRGTVIDNINDRYWGPRYLGARRMVTQ